MPAAPAIQLFAAAALCFCAGGLYGWSALVPVIETVFDGSTAQAGRIFSFAIVSFTLAVLIIPRLNERVKSLFSTAVIAVVGAVFLLLASLSNHYWPFLFFFSAGYGFVSGALYINALSMAAATRYSTWLTPVMVAAFGLGGVVFGPLWRQLIARDWGTQALLPLAGLMLISGFITLIVVRRTLSNQLDPAPVAQLSGRAHNTLLSIKLKTEDAWRLILIWAMFATGSTAGLMVLGLASKIIEQAGGTVAVASAGLAGMAFGNTVGRLSVGVQSFFIGATPVALVATFVVGSGLLLVLFSSAAATIAIGLSLVAFGYGIMASAIPSIVQHQFGASNFSSYFSIVFTAWGLAGLISPWMAGALYDASGSFTTAIQLALFVTVLCGALVIGYGMLVARSIPK